MRVAIPVNLNEVQESRPVPNAKYDLTIASVEEGKSKNGFAQLVVSIGIDGHDDAPNVTHYISLPTAGDEKAQAKALFLTRFLEAFNIPHEDLSFDTDDFLGAKASLELTMSEPDANNRVYNRLVVPYLKDEPAKGNVAGRRSPPPPKR